jgi:hypothetical protein
MTATGQRIANGVGVEFLAKALGGRVVALPKRRPPKASAARRRWALPGSKVFDDLAKEAKRANDLRESA